MHKTLIKRQLTLILLYTYWPISYADGSVALSRLCSIAAYAAAAVGIPCIRLVFALLFFSLPFHSSLFSFLLLIHSFMRNVVAVHNGGSSSRSFTSTLYGYLLHAQACPCARANAQYKGLGEERTIHQACCCYRYCLDAFCCPDIPTKQ